jgi:hypothetical protein
MRKLIKGSLLIIMPVIILSIFSCAAGSCFEETESYLKVSFYYYSTSKLNTTDSLTIYGLNRDSILYNNVPNIHPALFPLNASSESSTFIIIFKGISDTIEFKYSSYPHLISKECGYTYYHHLDTVPKYTTHFIKELKTDNETITNLNVQNISILF